MRNALLLAAAVTIAVLVTVEVPARPDAAFQADFEPAIQTNMDLGLATPPAPGVAISVA